MTDRQQELRELRAEYMARFGTDPDIARLDVEDAIDRMRAVLRERRLELLQPGAVPRNRR
jgi:hypothetical protein